MSRLRVIHWDGSSDYYLPMNDKLTPLYINNNPDFKSNTFRYVYNSMTTPTSVIEFNTPIKNHILKTQEVWEENLIRKIITLKGFGLMEEMEKKSLSPLFITKIPIFNLDTPILQYAYGSYGSTVDASFSSARLSLLDRGFAFAIAHIRGGEYLGRQWYEDGKLLNKKTPFLILLIAQNF